jgi:hypothetical protein
MAKLLERMGPQPMPTIHPEVARKAYAIHREAAGLWPGPPPLLTPWEANGKYAKSETPTLGLALAPASSSGVNVCPKSTPECREHCVSKAGKGRFARTTNVRIVRTTFLAEEPEAFLRLLVSEIDQAVAYYERINLRLNTFSDLPWETIAPWLFERWGDAVTFYDYTKVWTRTPPPNYRLTLSASERTSRRAIARAVDDGQAVAVVVRVRKKDPMPVAFDGREMIDGDKTDDRTQDRGVVVGLRPKGTMARSSMVFDV